jgi:hypothetical protein
MPEEREGDLRVLLDPEAAEVGTGWKVADAHREDSRGSLFVDAGSA